jgi:hypothetical protein
VIKLDDKHAIVCSVCGAKFDNVEVAEKHVCPDAPTDRIDVDEVPRTDGDPRIDRHGRSARARVTQSYAAAPKVIARFVKRIGFDAAGRVVHASPTLEIVDGGQV